MSRFFHPRGNYTEYGPEATLVVVRGFAAGADPVPEGPQTMDIKDFRHWWKFPPDLNQAYELTTDCHFPHFVPSRKRPAIYRAASKQTTTTGDDGAVSSSAMDQGLPPSTAEMALADDTRPSTLDLNSDYTGIYFPAKASSRDYADGHTFDYCTRCEAKHIELGEDDTLPKRDTCASYLPDWFPVERYQHPWQAFQGLYDAILYEHSLFLTKNADTGVPDDKQWTPGLHLHERHPKWFSLGHRSCWGWWKCRSGPNATRMERNCEKCGRVELEHVPTFDEMTGTLDLRKQALLAWVEMIMRWLGWVDRETAIGIIRKLDPSTIEAFPYYPPHDWYYVPEPRLQAQRRHARLSIERRAPSAAVVVGSPQSEELDPACFLTDEVPALDLRERLRSRSRSRDRGKGKAKTEIMPVANEASLVKLDNHERRARSSREENIPLVTKAKVDFQDDPWNARGAQHVGGEHQDSISAVGESPGPRRIGKNSATGMVIPPKV